MPTILGTVEYGGDGKAALIHLVNQAENLNLQLTNFEFQLPEVPTNNNPIRNTKIKLAPKAGSGFYGVKTIWYNRIHINELGTIQVPRGNATLISELLPAINLKYGVLITPEDIIDAALPNVSSGTLLDIELLFSPSSVVFYGGTQIVLGNDTNFVPDAFVIDTMMFGTDTVDYNFNILQNNNLPIKLLEQWTLSVDKDFNRKNFCTTLPGTDLLNADQIALGKLSNTDNQNFRSKFPFIYSWFTATGTPRALTPYGEVLELIDDGNIWQSICFLDTNKRNNTDVINGITQLQEYGGTLVLNATKSSNGTLYVIFTPGAAEGGLKPLQRVIYKSTNGGNTWTVVNYTATGTAIKDSNFTVKTYADFIARDNKLFLLTGDGNDSVIYNNSEYSLPLIEELNLDNNTYAIKSIGDVVLTNTGVQIGNASGVNTNCLEFIDDATTFTTPRVAVYGKTKVSNHPVLAIYDFNGFLPTGTIINTNSLNKEVHSVPGNFVQAYSLPLTNHPGSYLDVIEITHPTITSDTDIGFLYAFGEIPGSTTNYTFGQKVFTSVRSNNLKQAWHESTVALNKRYVPTKVKLTKPNGTTIKAVSQGENALMTKTFTWNNDNSSYNVEVRRGSNYDNARAIDSICKHGLTKTISFFVTEPLSNYAYNYTLPTPTEANKDAIHLSFMAKDINSNADIWYVVKQNSLVLEQRTISNEYKFLGEYPVATVCDGNNIYACLNNGSVIVSSTFGKSWRDYSTFSHFGRPLNNTNYAFSGYFGFSKEAVTTQSFIRGGIVRDKICLQLNTRAIFNLKAFKVNTGGVGNATVGHSSAFHGNVLEIPAGNTATYIENASTYNSLGLNSPYKVNVWDLNNDSVVKLANRSEQSFNSNTGQWEYSTIEDSNISLNPGIDLEINEVIGVYTNLKYLDVTYAVLAKQIVGFNSNYYLHMVRNTTEEEELITIPLPHLSVATALDTKRKIAFHLWDGIETYYVPFVVINHTAAYLISRLENNGNFIVIPVNIEIPNDNGSELKPLAMFNANRLEYYFVQQGNGIFKMKVPVSILAGIMNNYTVMFNGEQVTLGFEPLVKDFPGVTSNKLTLEKVVNVNSLPSNIILQSGCESSREEIYAPIDSLSNVPGTTSLLNLNYAGQDNTTGGTITV